MKRKKPDCGVLLEKFGDGRRSRPPARRANRRGRDGIADDCRLPDLPRLLEIDAKAEAVAAAARAATVYRDTLLRRLLVVSHAGRLWRVAPRANGWSARTPLTLTDEAQGQRPRPARDVAAKWLTLAATAMRNAALLQRIQQRATVTKWKKPVFRRKVLVRSGLFEGDQ